MSYWSAGYCPRSRLPQSFEHGAPAGSPSDQIRRHAESAADAETVRDAIEGLEDFGGETMLKARVRAVPEAGRANTALVKLIAAWLELPARNVSVAQGTKSRLKHLAIEGDASELARLIETRLAALAR